MPYDIAPCDPLRDRDDVLDLWESAFGGLPAERLPWMYASNPAGPPVCWLARSRNENRAVGFAAVIPRNFRFRDRTLRGGIAADFSVAAGHRGLGPALRLQRALVADAFERGYDFLYGLPNRHSAPLLGRVGFRIIAHLSSFTRLLRSGRKLAERLGRSAGRLLSPIVDVGIRSVSVIGAVRSGSPRIAFETPPCFDGSLGPLVRNAIREHPFLGERDSVFLNWRFLPSPHTRHEIFAISRRNGEYSGYVVFHEQDDRVSIDDLLCEPPMYEALLNRFLRAQARRGRESVSVTCLASRGLRRALRRQGFVLRSSAVDPLYVLVNPAMPHARVASEADAWWFFRADNDV